MRKLLKKYGFVSTTIVTDHLVAYAAAMSDLPVSGRQERGKRKNNRAENSHVPIRRHERKMQGFKSPGSAQRFLSIHAAIYNIFNTCRDPISAANQRLLRGEALAGWHRIAGIAA
jgi:putative transposase